MKFLRHSIANGNRWQVYKQLELIPDTVLKSSPNKSRFLFGLDIAWQTLLSLLVNELVEEQLVEYLERCWELDESGQNQQNNSSFLQRLWMLMN
ncbi:MAG: hypothetical protein ACRC2R_15660 [Xenococcaceae cyanobacterium]